jgi:hypothetical protein
MLSGKSGFKIWEYYRDNGIAMNAKSFSGECPIAMMAL